MAQFFGLCASNWDSRHQQGRSWRGLARYAVDGSTLRVPDSQDNRQHFSLSTHLLRDAVFGEYGTNEMRYARQLLQSIPDHSLTVFDKGFLSAEILLQVQQAGTARHWLIPAKSNSKWQRLDEQTGGDYRVRMKVSPQAHKANPQLPEYWEARAIETISTRGQRRAGATVVQAVRPEHGLHLGQVGAAVAEGCKPAGAR
ncbi:transposase [Pantoea sp. 18069]|uniref:transposase n=1 Tax=Pantoea sp. 18069 TaxID=2681415 RepID=UPI0027D31BE9|nr:transposase [Pantoea sp. 18069]